MAQSSLIAASRWSGSSGRHYCITCPGRLANTSRIYQYIHLHQHTASKTFLRWYASHSLCLHRCDAAADTPWREEGGGSRMEKPSRMHACRSCTSLPFRPTPHPPARRRRPPPRPPRSPSPSSSGVATMSAVSGQEVLQTTLRGQWDGLHACTTADVLAPTLCAPPADGARESQAVPQRLDREAGRREAQVGHGVQGCVGGRRRRRPSAARFQHQQLVAAAATYRATAAWHSHVGRISCSAASASSVPPHGLPPPPPKAPRRFPSLDAGVLLSLQATLCPWTAT